MKIRMRVLQPFNRNLDGQMVTGHPQHPDPAGRFVHVEEASALVLETEELAERYSLRDEVLDSVAGEDEDAGDVAQQEEEAALASGTTTSRAVQQRRTAGRRPPPAATPGRRAKKPAALKDGDVVAAGIPEGGRSDNATTNHPDATLAGADTLDALVSGDPDAAP